VRNAQIAIRDWIEVTKTAGGALLLQGSVYNKSYSPHLGAKRFSAFPVKHWRGCRFVDWPIAYSASGCTINVPGGFTTPGVPPARSPSPCSGRAILFS